MASPDLIANRIAVFASGLVYWAGVFIQARRIRRLIGRSPNVKPRGRKEKLLWAGWMFVVVSWLSLPFLANIGTSSPCFRIIAPFYGRAGFVLGLGLLAAGYAGTIWCYAAMGNTWRMGIKPTEKTALVKHGPYRFVRHPIYLFQILMLAGVVLLLPSALSLAVLLVHGVCVLAKTADEENYLRTVHGSEYEDYLSRSGKFLPKFRAKSGPKRAAASRGVAR